MEGVKRWRQGWAVLAAGLLMLGAAAPEGPPPQSPELAAQLAALKSATPEELLARARASVAALGAYKQRSTVEERIKGVLKPAHVLQQWIREDPRAVRLEFIAGRAKGRKVLYDSMARPGELRVREPGLLGLAGALWIRVDSSLVFGDTNHPITDVGLGAVLRIQTADFDRAKTFGGYTRTDEGLNERGHYCIRYDAPARAVGLYAARSLVCLDPATALPLEVTVWDPQGLLERYTFFAIEPHAAEGPDAFDRKAAGL